MVKRPTSALFATSAEASEHNGSLDDREKTMKFYSMDEAGERERAADEDETPVDPIVILVPEYYNVADKLPENEQSVMTCGRVRWSNGDCPKWFANEFHNGEFSNYPECVKYWFPLPEIPEDVLRG